MHKTRCIKLVVRLTEKYISNVAIHAQCNFVIIYFLETHMCILKA